jgi:hypothetical protein
MKITYSPPISYFPGIIPNKVCRHLLTSLLITKADLMNLKSGVYLSFK